MKLQEQFLKAHYISGGIGMNEKQANHCEKIADEFAINFVDWSDSLDIGEWSGKTIKELLQIYKNEKGL